MYGDKIKALKIAAALAGVPVASRPPVGATETYQMMHEAMAKQDEMLAQMRKALLTEGWLEGTAELPQQGKDGKPSVFVLVDKGRQITCFVLYGGAKGTNTPQDISCLRY